MGQYIVLGLNILLAVFVVFGVIWGLIRGLRKTASRGIFLIITSIILLFVTIPITSALLKIRVNTDITIGESTLTGQMSIEEIVAYLVKSFLGNDFSNKNPEFVKVITALPLVFINAIVYLILFWICKYLLLPLNYLFYKLTFAPRKPKENLGFSSFGENENEYSQPLSPSDTTPSTQNTSDASQVQSQQETVNTNATKPRPQGEMNYTQESVQFKNLKQENLTATQNIFGNDGTFIKKEIEPQNPEIPKFDFAENQTVESRETKPAKKKKEKKQKIKYNKHRLWGALVGGFVGLFVMLNTLIPVYGFMGVLKDVNAVKLENIEEETIDIDQQTNGLTSEILQSYEKSILKPVSKYLGIEGLGLAEFDYLTTQKINNTNVTLRKDVQNIVATAKQADALIGKYKFYTSGGNLSSLTQEQMATLIADSKNLLATAKKVNLVDCVSEYLIPVACTLVVNSNTTLSDNQIVNKLMIDAIKALAESKGINVFVESTNLLDLADYLNNQGLLVRILQNNFAKPIDIIQGLDNDFGTQFTTRLFNLQTVNLTMPYILNIGLNFLQTALNLNYQEVNYTTENLKVSFSNLVNQSVTMIKTLDTNSSIYLTTESLAPLGQLLDTIKSSGIIDTYTYQNLIGYAIDTIGDLLGNLLPTQFEDYTKNEFLNNIKVVDHWETEMQTIAEVVRSLRDKEKGFLGEIVDGKDLRQGTKIDTIVFSEKVFGNLGECLDKLDKTCLFTARNKTATDGNPHLVSGTISLFTSILDYANNNITSSSSIKSLEKLNTVFAKMKNNLIISNHTYEDGNTFWKDELTKVVSLISEVYDMIDTSNFDITSTFGKSLDKAKCTTLFGNGVTLDFMNVAVDAISEIILPDDFEYNAGSTTNPQSINDVMYEMFNQIKANLNSNDEQILKDSNKAGFWQTEIEYLQTLQKIAKKASDLQNIQKVKEIGADLDSLASCSTQTDHTSIIPNDKIYKLVSVAVKNAKDTTATDATQTKINSIIDKISDRLNTIAGKVATKDTLIGGQTFAKSIENFWQIELEHITSLTDTEFGGDNLLSRIDSIGITLDKVVYKNDTTRLSLLITSDDIRELIATSIESMSADITSKFAEGKIRNAVQHALEGTPATSTTPKINGIIDNIQDTSITPISFERELTNLKNLSELKVTEDMLECPTKNDGESDSAYADRVQRTQQKNQQSLNSLGQSLDNIAFVTSGDDTLGYSYTNIYSNTEGNSKIITRDILTSLIIEIFDASKVTITSEDSADEQTQKNAFNTLISNVAEQMTNIRDNDKVMSWQRELGFVNKLVALNKEVVYSIDNVADEVGKNLDAIAFNTIKDENNIAHQFVDFAYKSTGESVQKPSTAEGNSLFITRNALKDMMKNFLSTVKKDTTTGDELEKEKNVIINGLIDNAVGNIATVNEYTSTTPQALSLNSDTNVYNNLYEGFYASLSDLKSIENDLNTNLSNATAHADAIKDGTLAANLDKLLRDFQIKPVSGVTLTREMAMLILKNINKTMLDALSLTNDYYKDLMSYYDTRSKYATPDIYPETYVTDTLDENLNITNKSDASYYADPFRSLKESLTRGI